MEVSPQPSSQSQNVRAEAHRRRAVLAMTVVAVLFVIVPFLFWRGTWFGRSLTEDEVGRYLSDQEKPRHIQHALVQIGERISRGDPGVKRWYPTLMDLADHPLPEIRNTLAWVMGTDNRSEPFHQALLALLKDAEPVVRRNAALSLVRFGDASGKEELRAMLRPFSLRSPADGILRYRLQEGDAVERGTLLARLEGNGEEPLEIRSPLPGSVQSWQKRDGIQVAAGEEILILSPGSEHVWEALRALYLVGQEEDLPEVRRFARGLGSDMPANIQQQAALTADEIRRRASAKAASSLRSE